MSTLEALNAISEAIQAHARLPEVERQLKEAREAHDFALLELEEARAEIERLKADIELLRKVEIDQANRIQELNVTVSELTSRNTQLDQSLHDVTTLYNDAQHTITERNLQIESLCFTVDSLSERLAESKSVTARLTDTLKSIGQSIVSAVAEPEPEVSNPSTFRDAVAVSDPASTELDGSNNSEPMSALVEPTGQDMVSDNQTQSTADGCNVYRYW